MNVLTEHRTAERNAVVWWTPSGRNPNKDTDGELSRRPPDWDTERREARSGTANESRCLIVHRLTTLLQEVSSGLIFRPKAPVGPHKKSLRLSEVVLGFVRNVFSELLLAHHACRKETKKPGINTKAEATGTASTPPNTTQLTMIVFDDLD